MIQIDFTRIPASLQHVADVTVVNEIVGDQLEPGWWITYDDIWRQWMYWNENHETANVAKTFAEAVDAILEINEIEVQF